MRRIKLVLALAAVLLATLIVTAGPAMADNNRQENRQDRWEDRWDRWEDRHDNVFGADVDDFGFFLVDEVEVDVDEEEVGARNDNEGECFVEEIDWDLDGFIAEWEIDIVCFV
jgi:Ni/Co efflux regulator RcnB